MSRITKKCKCCGTRNEHDWGETICRLCNWKIRRGRPLTTSYPIRSIYEMTRKAPGFSAFCAPRLMSGGKRLAMKKAPHGASYRAAFAAFCKPRGLNSILGPYTTGRGTSQEQETATLYRVKKGGLAFDSRLPLPVPPETGQEEAA
jgi:hypothetical protein